jgi:hypothetical protein
MRLKKEHLMNRITKISLFASGLAALGALAVFSFPAMVQAADDNIFSFDVACDCRTGSPGFFTGSRGDVFIVNGKIFPAGTLPSGTATNDPTLPVRGIASIGDWICRGQAALPFPPAVAPAYTQIPPFFNTQYYIFNDGRALTAEGYDLPVTFTGILALTGGIGGFSGASGGLIGEIIGTNITGCPNLRFKINFQPGSMRGSSN